MGVTIRGTKFHYRFRLHGQEYSGPCPGITIPQTAKAGEISVLRRRAVSYEAGVRLQAEKELAEKARQDEEIRRNRTVRALVENYRYELTGGRPVPVAQAYEIAVAKPSRRQAISRFAEQRKVYYLDFAAFIENTFPEVLTISDIRRAHCEAYVVSLVEHGRFVKSVSYSVRQKRGVKEVSYHRDSRWWKRRIGRKRAIQS